jgi:hypothetical protein
MRENVTPRRFATRFPKMFNEPNRNQHAISTLSKRVSTNGVTSNNRDIEAIWPAHEVAVGEFQIFNDAC